MKEIRLQHVKAQQEKGIELIPIGDFTYYDHVLDTAYMLGFIPSRFLSLHLTLMYISQWRVALKIT